ncbi:MAG TPA: DUF2071 domain-containing protein [Candidatus Acidoferrum sp.]|nr:DUF2071 domain-containing protein [Candidatus Acidoferrum sp.]
MQTSTERESAVHRPWPAPGRNWIMAQTWHDLLFAHWPVPKEVLRTKIPPQLDLDLFDGESWLGIVPFRMSGVRVRGTPGVPCLSNFPEMNVRTYVVAGGKRGVWFFSLDAANAIAVAVARRWFHLPYYRARMSCGERNGWIEYVSERTHRGAAECNVRARYRAIGEPFAAKQGTREHFLVERYCLYAAGSNGRLMRGEIHHKPWMLQTAEVEWARNSAAEAAGISLPPVEPLLHFSKRQDVVVWPLEEVPARVW